MKDIGGAVAYLMIVFGASLITAVLCTATNMAIGMVTEVFETKIQYAKLVPPKAPLAPEAPEPEPAQPLTGRNHIENEIIRVFGNESRLAIAVAKAESGLNPRAVNQNRNGTKDIGVFQINDCHYFTESERFDWRQNIWLAKQVKDTYGWRAWVAYKNGSYRQFL